MPTNAFASTGTVTSRPARLHRSCLAVSGSGPTTNAGAACSYPTPEGGPMWLTD